MKRSRLVISVVFASLFLFAPAFSQTVPIRVTVPFDFTVADQRLPAGEYRVAIVNDSVLRVLSMDGSIVAHVTTHISGGSNQDATSKLVFHCYGDRRFLSEVRIQEVSHQLFVSGSELEYARTERHGCGTIVLFKYRMKARSDPGFFQNACGSIIGKD